MGMTDGEALVTGLVVSALVTPTLREIWDELPFLYEDSNHNYVNAIGVKLEGKTYRITIEE